jgi:galactokinase
VSPAWVDAWTRDDGAARVRAAFTDRFGAEPDGVWSAPGRVNIIGEHTDYNGGLCLPIALPHRAYVALRSRADDEVTLASAQEGGEATSVHLADVGPGTVTGWTAYVLGVAWALREMGHPVRGFDVVVDSCVPYGAGLSSSAALECAVAVALDDVHDLGLGGDDDGRVTLVTACVRAENEIAGAPTGGLDQSASLRCAEGNALLLDCRDGSGRQIPFDLAADGLALLVMDTRAEHKHSDGQYAERRATCEKAAGLLGVPTLREITDVEAATERLRSELDPAAFEVTARRVRHVVTEIQRVELVEQLVRSGRLSEVGAVLTAAHASLRDDYEVSSVELDRAVDTAIVAGALGGRMVGGGFGGSAIALVAAADVHRVADAVAQAFARDGLGAPAFLVATAAGPADRD